MLPSNITLVVFAIVVLDPSVCTESVDVFVDRESDCVVLSVTDAVSVKLFCDEKNGDCVLLTSDIALVDVAIVLLGPYVCTESVDVFVD